MSVCKTKNCKWSPFLQTYVKVSHLVFFSSSVYIKVCSVSLSVKSVCVCLLFWYEGLDSRESCRLSAKSRNNQQPQQEAAFLASRSISPILATPCTHTHIHARLYCTLASMRTIAHTERHTGKHPMTFPAYSHKQIDNSPESLKTALVWAQ